MCMQFRDKLTAVCYFAGEQ